MLRNLLTTAALALLPALLVGDMFCGAGGTATGLGQALAESGRRVKIRSINHDEVAIATHKANHPDVEHFNSNVYRLSPLEAVPEGYLDLLMASPTCTFFSTARGGRPISRDQRWGRMTPTQVYRWCKELNVRRLLVENVPEFVRWGPCKLVSPIGEEPKLWKPNPARAGAYFRRWIKRLESLGYRIKWKVVCCADLGDATTRERFFLIATKDGTEPQWPEKTHDEHGGEAGQGDLFSGRFEKWRAARECIDPTIRGKSILTRKKQLSVKTLARMRKGAVKLGWPLPFVVLLDRLINGEPLDAPLPPMPNGARAVPIIFQANQGRERLRNIRSADDPLSTVTTRSFFGLASAVIRVDNQGGKAFARSDEDPLYAITTNGGIGVVQPLLVPQHGGGAARSTESPTPTITTEGAIAFVAPYYSNGTPRSIDKPLPAATTRDRFGVVFPVTHHDDSDRTRSTDQPLPTITTAKRGEIAYVLPATFGEREGQAPRCRTGDEPFPTICATRAIPVAEPVEAHDDVDQVVYIDILYRMLEPHELAAATSFPRGYLWACETKEDKVRLIGNAVPVRTAKALTRALLGLDRRAA